MFTRYWRNYPWFLQFFLFIIMIFTFASLGSLIVLSVIPKITGVTFNEIQHINIKSEIRVSRAALLVQGLSQLFTFILPSFLFAYLTHPKPLEYLGIRLPGKPVHWILVTGIMLGFLPISLFLESWLQQHLYLGKTIQELQTKNDETFAIYMQMRSVGDLIRVSITLAILPPVGEELFFRALLMRFIHNRPKISKQLFSNSSAQRLSSPAKTMMLPIIVTALIFAWMHPNPYGRIFIFSSGALLATIYWLTGSLLCSIWAHLLFNGAQVVGVFFGTQAGTPAIAGTPASDAIPLWLPLAGLALLAASLYGLYRMRTPLPPDWSADFSYEELQAMHEERNRS